MRKLLVTCICKERIQVPCSALGRTGLCPSCGRSITITNDNAVPMNTFKYAGLADARQTFGNDPAGAGVRADVGLDPEEANRKYGEAVDYYFVGRYAQAIVIFNQLQSRLPKDPDIACGIRLCLSALRSRPPAMMIEHTGTEIPGIGFDDEEAEPEAPEQPVQQTLTAQTVCDVIMDKLLNGSTEEVQLQAAELAGRMTGLLSDEPLDEQQAADFACTLDQDDTLAHHDMDGDEWETDAAPTEPRRASF